MWNHDVELLKNDEVEVIIESCTTACRKEYVQFLVVVFSSHGDES